MSACKHVQCPVLRVGVRPAGECGQCPSAGMPVSASPPGGPPGLDSARREPARLFPPPLLWSGSLKAPPRKLWKDGQGLCLFRGLDFAETRPRVFHPLCPPTPPPSTSLRLGQLPGVGGGEKGGRGCDSRSLFPCCLHPTPFRRAGHQTAAGGGAVSVRSSLAAAAPASSPSLCSLLATLLPGPMRNEEPVLEGHGSAVG